MVDDIDFAGLVFAALLELLFWGRVPDRLSLAGALLVVLAGVIALRMDRAPILEDT